MPRAQTLDCFGKTVTKLRPWATKETIKGLRPLLPVPFCPDSVKKQQNKTEIPKKDFRNFL